MRDRTITLSSAGKTFSLTGWKIGWALAPPDLSEAIRRVHQFVTFASATPFQEAIATAIETAEHTGYFSVFLADYIARRDFLCHALDAAGPAIRCNREGSFFILADIAGLGFPDDVTFARTLTTDAGVACIPPSVFYSGPRPQPTGPLLLRQAPRDVAGGGRSAGGVGKETGVRLSCPPSLSA